MKRIVLKIWAPGLGDHNFYTVTNDSNVVPQKDRDIPTVNDISGAYAKYKEGLFAVWIDSGTKEIWVIWNGSSAKINSDCKVTWVSKPFSRKFAIETSTGESISFKYKTILFESWRLITDFFIPDDDWGLFLICVRLYIHHICKVI